MSLIIFKKPKIQTQNLANELTPGTWFTDKEDQIYLVVLDDRTNEKRVLCTGHFYSPFITNISPKDFEIHKILPTGTLLQISSSLNKGVNS